MAAKKINTESEDESFKLYSMKEIMSITSYGRKAIEKFVRNGELKTRKLNNGKRVSTKKWIKEFLDSISDEGPLEF